MNEDINFMVIKQFPTSEQLKWEDAEQDASDSRNSNGIYENKCIGCLTQTQVNSDRLCDRCAHLDDDWDGKLLALINQQ